MFHRIFLSLIFFLSVFLFAVDTSVAAGMCFGDTTGGSGTCQPSILQCPSGKIESAAICGTQYCCLDVSGTGTGTGSGTGSGTGTGTASIDCDGEVKAGVCFPTSASTGLSDMSVVDLLMNLMNWLLAVLGFIAIIAFVISGLQYLLAVGEEKMIETAKRNMQYSIIGVIVALSGWVVIQAIDTALSGSGYFF